MGRGPKSIHAHLIGDLLVVWLQGVLTAAEQHLVRSLPAERGRDLLKQVQTQLIEAARSVLEVLVEEVSGAKPLSLHHDISTSTGEEVVIFTLRGSPQFRATKRNQAIRGAATGYLNRLAATNSANHNDAVRLSVPPSGSRDSPPGTLRRFDSPYFLCWRLHDASAHHRR